MSKFVWCSDCENDDGFSISYQWGTYFGQGDGDKEHRCKVSHSGNHPVISSPDHPATDCPKFKPIGTELKELLKDNGYEVFDIFPDPNRNVCPDCAREAHDGECQPMGKWTGGTHY